MTERLAVESGRLAAMVTGEARSGRVGIASGGREASPHKRRLKSDTISVPGG